MLRAQYKGDSTMTFDEACEILKPWINSGKTIKRSLYLCDGTDVGPPPYLRSIHDNIEITCLPFGTGTYAMYNTPTIKAYPSRVIIPSDYIKAADIWSKYYRGPEAFI